MAPLLSEMSPYCSNKTYTVKDNHSSDGDITGCSAFLNSSISDEPVCNPFGSFRHSGPLSYSLFEDPSSFSHSPSRESSSMQICSSDHEDSTHIYMNMLEESEICVEKVSFESLKYRSPPDGKEDSLLCSSDEAKRTAPQNKPICHHPVSCRLSSTKRRLLAKKMKQMRKILQDTDKQNSSLKLLAIL